MALAVRTVSAMAQPPASEGGADQTPAGGPRASPGVRPRSSGIIGRVSGELWTVHLGVVEYRAAHDLQERLRAARQAGAIPDTLLLLEHEPVYTRGRRSAPGELGMGEDWYRARGIDIVDVDRGGGGPSPRPGAPGGHPLGALADPMAYGARRQGA